MALPVLPNVYFSHTCPNCGLTRSETGVWFRSVSSYKCEACSTRVRIPYEEKVRLLCRDTEGSHNSPHSSDLSPSGATAEQPPSDARRD
jgi:hypothetical protein